VQVLYRDMIDRLVEPPHRAKHRFVTFKGDGNWLAQAQQAGNVQEEAIPKAILETDRQALVLRTSSGADAKRIQVFGSMKDVDPQRQVPTDVCVDPSNGNVYITMGAKNSISILSKDGNLIGHLGDFASSESELNTPCGVTVFGENVLVSDSGNHRIVVYNKLSRKQIQTFGAQGTIPGKLRRPMQLCTSISGNVIVADRFLSKSVSVSMSLSVVVSLSQELSHAVYNTMTVLHTYSSAALHFRLAYVQCQQKGRCMGLAQCTLSVLCWWCSQRASAKLQVCGSSSCSHS